MQKEANQDREVPIDKKLVFKALKKWKNLKENLEYNRRIINLKRFVKKQGEKSGWIISKNSKMVKGIK